MANDFFNNAGAVLRGFGRGASGGISDYLGAMAIKGARAVQGNAPITYQEALDEVRAQNAEAQQQHPGAYTAGNIGGALTGGIALSGGTLPVMIAKNAAFGGAGGFTANPGISDSTFQDTLTGAALGAGGGAVTGAVQKVAGKLSLGAMINRNREIAKNLDKEIEFTLKQREAAKELLKNSSNKAERAQAREYLQSINEKIPQVQDYIRSNKASLQNLVNLTDEAALAKAANLKKSPLTKEARGLFTGDSPAWAAPPPVNVGLGSGIAGAGIGGATGALLADQLGYDPYMGAAIGGAGIGGANLGMTALRAKMALGAAGAKYSLPGLVGATTQSIIPLAAASENAPQENPPWMDEYVAPQPVAKSASTPERMPWED